MNTKGSLTRREAVEQIVAQIDGPIEINELCRRVLEIYPSGAKDPVSSMRRFIRSEGNGTLLVFTDQETVLPIRVAMKGVRFRISLSRSEVNRGVLLVHPAFDYFLRREVEPASVQLHDSQGRSLPVEATTIPERVTTHFGDDHVVEHEAFDLGQWFTEKEVWRKDDLIVTVEDWVKGRFRLQHEPAKRRRKQKIRRQDQELADVMFDLLEHARDEMLYGSVAVPMAYARLSNPRGYPGSHWIEIIAEDSRMRYDGFAIRYADWRGPLDDILYGEEPVPQKSFSAEQGRQVYRFKASLWHRSGLWRVIEIQGKQTLSELDSILRNAFEHDTFDHMGGFWKRVRRGDTRRFREVDLGSVNPLGGGDGAGVAIAGLELGEGQELKYVYDFGDWIEHRLTLQEIVEPEADATYPRVVDQNKPRYKDCVTCKDQGRKRRATWICLECSNREQREVLLCEECLMRDHESHYADEILY